MATNLFSLPRLPSCQLCYQRKVRCDNQRPKCKPCSKADVECVMGSSENGELILREYIHELEQQARQLSLILSPSGSPQSPSVSSVNLVSSRTPHLTERSPSQATAISGSSGLGFMAPLFADSEWTGDNARVLQNLSNAKTVAEATVRPNSLPDTTAARMLFDRYLEGSHVQNPFLLRNEVNLLFTRIFNAENPAKRSSHDLFRTFMILAIGSIMPYRKGLHHCHPFGYYIAAMQHFDPDFLINGLPAIQDLLLICRFGIYHHIGTSIWEIIQLCVRMCIEQGLHLPRETPCSLLQEQIERRVFWECYMIDRYSSNTLDRPFAIAEHDIKVGFPAEANDEDVVIATSNSLDAFHSTSSRSYNEMSVFLFCVRLRQISSQFPHQLAHAVHVSDTGHGQFSSGKLYTTLNRVLHDLGEWRNKAPVIENPKCLYEKPEWYDLLYAREKLQIIRRALDLAPRRQGIPPKDLLVECLQSAVRLIIHFTECYRRQVVTYTRSYFQLIFTAGLSVIYALSVGPPLERNTVQEAYNTLIRAEECLALMGANLPDAEHYATAFGALRRNILKKMTESAQRAQDQDHTPLDSRPFSNTAIQQSGGDIPIRENEDTQAYNPSQADSAHRYETNDTRVLMGIDTLTNPALFDNNMNFYDSGMQWYQGFTQNDHATTDNTLVYMDNPLQMAFLNDDLLETIEAGLGEYAYGDPSLSSSLLPEFNFNP